MKKTEKKVYPREIEKLVDDMSLMDDDLMSRVLDHNIPATELLLRTILQQEVEVLETLGQEEMKNPLVDGRSIRVDVLAKDKKGRYFNCEVQRKDTGAHPCRARFHSAMMDSRMLRASEEFSSIKDSYVIFLTERDYFSQGKPLYFVERKINAEKAFGDGNFIVYVNGAYEGEDEIGRLMKDMKRQETTGFFHKELEVGVRHFKVEEGRAVMCEAVEKYANGKYADGLEKGVEQTRNNLVQNMLRNGMSSEEISRNAGVDLETVKRIEQLMLQSV